VSKEHPWTLDAPLRLYTDEQIDAMNLGTGYIARFLFFLKKLNRLENDRDFHDARTHFIVRANLIYDETGRRRSVGG
jgi:hypothetical protein